MSPVNKYPTIAGSPTLLAAKPLVAATSKTAPTLRTRGAVSTIDAMCEAYGKSPSVWRGFFVRKF
jgi:hypothetical protein